MTPVESVSLSARQWFVLILLSSVSILNGCIYTLQAPFYPAEAVSKNSTALGYGAVFGTYELTVFGFCPIFGSTMPLLGSKRVFNVGLFVQGVTTALFGFLDKINDLTQFLGFSLFLRLLEGIGFAGTFVAMYSFVPSQFPDHIPIVYGVLEMTTGVGSTVGPALGGILFNLGGFILPFLVVGILIIGLLCIIIPTFGSMEICDGHSDSSRGLLTVLKKPAITINFFAALVEAAFVSAIYANLGQYLELSFNLTPLYIGLVYGVFGLSNAVLSPFWGYLLGKLPSPYYMVQVAAILDVIGIGMIGPVQYLGFEPNLVITLVGVFVYSVSHGALFLSTFINAMAQAKNHGFPADGSTAALISGCGMASGSLGGAIGPPIAGALYDAYGFRLTELCITGAAVFLNFVLIANACAGRFARKRSTESLHDSSTISEHTPLLESLSSSSTNSSSVTLT